MDEKDKPVDISQQSIRVVTKTGTPNERQITEEQQREEERDFGSQRRSESR